MLMMITDKATVTMMTKDCRVAMILGIYEESYLKWEVDETNNRRIIAGRRVRLSRNSINHAMSFWTYTIEEHQ